MRVFVTGGTGTIGGPTVAELIAHGHRVLGLARSDRAANQLVEAGAEPVRGALTDLDTIREAVSDTDGVISLAFGNDFTSSDAVGKSIDEEGAALAVIGESLIGSQKPAVTVSGTPWIAGRASTEADQLSHEGPVGRRADVVDQWLQLAERGARTSVVRIPRTAHNHGRGGFAGILTEVARRSGVAGYPGDGEQRWPAVHALDAAALLRMALESAAPGTCWHAVADEGDRVRDIAAVIGRRLDLPVRPVPDEAFGELAPIFAMDQPSSSAHTRAELGWQPTHPSLLDDLENLTP